MGPLAGKRVVELAGLGPAPYAGMLLADMGADVVLVERAGGMYKNRVADCSRRGKRSIPLNLKDADDIQTLLSLIEQADVLIEGFRPGVAERLGVGPDVCHARNPRLVYGRMTGWGQTGPLAQAAGHDINYISLTGALHAVGRAGDKPVPPLNLVGDFGGGSLFLIMGVLAALLERESSGQGQVIDAAMTDGSASLMTLMHTLHGMGAWTPQRGANMLDGAAHFYDTYETADGKYVSIGAIEPQFYAQLIELAELDAATFKQQHNASQWPTMTEALADVFKQKTRDDWCALLEGTDVCFAPVLDYVEAKDHPHNQARGTYLEVDGITQPAPAPRFSRTPSEVRHGAHAAGEDTEAILKDWLGV